MKTVSLVGLGCIGFIILGAILFMLEAFMGGALAIIIWNSNCLNSASLFHAANIDYFWQAVWIGAIGALIAQGPILSLKTSSVK